MRPQRARKMSQVRAGASASAAPLYHALANRRFCYSMRTQMRSIFMEHSILASAKPRAAMFAPISPMTRTHLGFSMCMRTVHEYVWELICRVSIPKMVVFE